MNRSGRLLIASILAVALMAPPAYPQNRNEKQILTDLERDVLDLKAAFGDMRNNTITKNDEMKALLQQILGRFTVIDASVQKLEGTLSAIKVSDEASVRGLQQANTTITELKKSIDTLNGLNLGQTLTNLNTQVGDLKKTVNELRNQEVPLPAAREAFNAADLELTQGFYDLAISDFKDFLNNYPTDVRAPKAQLNIGTAYFNQKKFDEALIQYELTIEKHPESEVKCTALYKKGQTLVELKQAAPARTAFERVVKECANTPEHPLAQQALRTAGRGGRGN
jgi:tol-pal system protein YbgF